MQSRSIWFVVFAAVVLAVAGTAACGSSPDQGSGNVDAGDDGTVGDGGGGGDVEASAAGTITIAPADVTLDLVQGQPSPTQIFTVTLHSASGDRDVSADTTFALTDATLGAMTKNVFSASPTHGGTTTLTATFPAPVGGPQMATATIHVRVHASVQGPDCMGTCGTFPGDGAPACTQSGVTPHIEYPASGVLLPPNLNGLSVQWTPFPGTNPTIQKFEIDFENALTDVRVVTKCTTELTDTAQPPVGTGGCAYAIDAATWALVAGSNRGGDAVKITVRATTDGTCATPSTNSADISFAEQDVGGGLFYWKSSLTAGGVGGNVWGKVFGSAQPEQQLTGVAGTNLAGVTCFGCHAPSRDGTRMVVNFDDADSDDEYGDIVHTLMDVGTKSSLDGHTNYGVFEPGFPAITPDRSVYAISNGNAAPPTNSFFMFDGMTGAALATPSATVGPAMVGSTAARPTMPDWAPDGKSIVYVQPAYAASWDGASRNDDAHIFGGSLLSATFDPATKLFGSPTAVVTSTGENNYYPNASPDGAFLVFNRVPAQTVANPITGRPDCTGTGQQVVCPNDSFYNPKARVVMIAMTPGAMPIDAVNANGSPVGSPIDVSNSWPRWSPVIQTYKGEKLLWMTFASTRDYGLRVRNHKVGMYACYPADSLQQAGAAHAQAFAVSCQQPQIWMAAVNLTRLAATGADASFTAFWMPYQDDTTHNHTMQWAQAISGQQ